MTDLVTQTLDQLERVVAIRERYREIARNMSKFGHGSSLGPAIAMMTADIDRAKDAIVTMDSTALIPALDSLKGYSNE